MRPRPWQQVLAALQALGVEAAGESVAHVAIVRGAIVIRTLPKLSMVPSEVQRSILSSFGITEQQFLAALPRD